MADDPPLAVDRLPTLTEVLDLGRGLPVRLAGTVAMALPVRVPTLTEPVVVAAAPLAAPPAGLPAAGEAMVWAEASAGATVFDEDALVERVLGALLPRIDGLLQARVGEALAPALARAADALIRESRQELAAVLRGLAEESLAQVLRQDGQGGQAGKRSDHSRS